MGSPELLVLLSGPLAVGKTTLRNQLVLQYDFDYIRSGRYLLEIAKREALDGGRRGLQELGDALDRRTDYQWLLNDVALAGFRANPERTRWLVDSVRKRRQVEHFKNTFGAAVLHVHLTAPEDVLRARYEARRSTNLESVDTTSYEEAIAHENEIASRDLIHAADLKIDVSNITPEEMAQKVISTYGE